VLYKEPCQSLIRPIVEALSVILFLNAKNIRPAEIHRHLVEVYEDGVMNEGNVRMWCRLFKGGRPVVHNDVRSGRPSVITEDSRQRTTTHCRKNDKVFGEILLKKS
jgi:hypothetical protein